MVSLSLYVKVEFSILEKIMLGNMKLMFHITSVPIEFPFTRILYDYTINDNHFLLNGS